MPKARLAPLAAAAAVSSAVALTFVAGPRVGGPGLPDSLRSISSTLEGTGVELPALQTTEGAAAAQPAGEAQEGPRAWRWLGAGLAAGLLLAASAAPQPAQAEIDFSSFSIKNSPRLGPCKDNKKYHKKFKDEVYKNQQRQKKYPKDSVVWKRFDTKVAQVKRVEEAYGTRLCGIADGLPRTIATGEMNVRGGIVIPALIFLYTTGWIGWAGREYLMRTRDKMKEINLDMPLVVTCMASGFAWPVASWQDIVNGKFVAKDTEIPRTGMA